PHAVTMKVEDKLYHEAVTNYSGRHRVKPGVTGWAQINGSRGEIATLDQAYRRVTLDLYYIDHWSIGLDLKILFRTLVCLIKDEAY
ncbi:sugar transferase, partial [Vibrio parahaemolyticus]